MLIVVVDPSHVLMILVVRHVLVRISSHISCIICERCERIWRIIIFFLSSFFFFLFLPSFTFSLFRSHPARLIMIFLFFSYYDETGTSFSIRIRILHFRLPREALLKQKDLMADFIA
jgi:hypothetical protein